MKRISFITICIPLLAISFAACEGDESTKSTDTLTTFENHSTMAHDTMQHSEHDKMMSGMAAVKMTGDIDLDFANMMIPHHQGAIDMSQEYLPKAKDEMIKVIAQKIIDAQKREIEEMKQMISRHKPDTGKGIKGHETLMGPMDKMAKEMNEAKPTGDADRDFVVMMIPHHQGAVDMAEAELAHGKSKEMKEFAQKIIKDQKAEIQIFKDWLAEKK